MSVSSFFESHVTVLIPMNAKMFVAFGFTHSFSLCHQGFFDHCQSVIRKLFGWLQNQKAAND